MIKYHEASETNNSLPELTTLAERQAKESFRPEYEADATEEGALGIVIAHHFLWDGHAIMRTFFAALEDANFHREAAIVDKWLKKAGF